ALLSLSIGGETLTLPLRISEELGAGLVALPAGLPGIPPALFGKSVDRLQEAAQ
ncbi:NADH dehydrogenase subunit G, partial [Pseudomonas amygdali pv. mori str. 301020]